MRIDGKLHRCVSALFLALHFIHFAVILAGSFLPYMNGQNLYEVFGSFRYLFYLGYVCLAIGCVCAWMVAKRPHYCLLAFVLTLPWHIIYLLFVLLPTSGALLGAALSGVSASDVFGLGDAMMAYGLLLIPVDIAFIVYMIVLMFVDSKTIVHKQIWDAVTENSEQ